MSDFAQAMERAKLYNAETPAPVNVDPPAVGPLTVTAGETLGCTVGNWDNNPDSYAWDWRRDGTSIGGNTNAETYTVQPEDVGTAIDCVVTATNAAGSTAAPPSNAVTPA